MEVSEWRPIFARLGATNTAGWIFPSRWWSRCGKHAKGTGVWSRHGSLANGDRQDDLHLSCLVRHGWIDIIWKPGFEMRHEYALRFNVREFRDPTRRWSSWQCHQTTKPAPPPLTMSSNGFAYAMTTRSCAKGSGPNWLKKCSSKNVLHSSL